MNLELPIIIVNFKTYRESTGMNAVSLAKDIERLAKDMQVNIAVSCQAIDLAMIAASLSISVLAQHVDGVGYGAHTGHICLDALKTLGVDGSLLNHSEKRLNDDQISEAINKMKELNMSSILCAESAEEGARLASLGSDLIAIEPPELIGGEVSVSTARPELISEAVRLIGPGKVIVGAGVKNTEDVRIAMKLGASGILVASGVVKAQNPIEALRALCQGFKI